MEWDLMRHFHSRSWGGKLPLNLPGRFCFDTLKRKISLSSHLRWAYVSKNMPIITKTGRRRKGKGCSRDEKLGPTCTNTVFLYLRQWKGYFYFLAQCRLLWFFLIWVFTWQETVSLTALIRNKRFDHSVRWNITSKHSTREVDASTGVPGCLGNWKGDRRQHCQRKLNRRTALGTLLGNDKESSKGRCLKTG